MSWLVNSVCSPRSSPRNMALLKVSLLISCFRNEYVARRWFEILRNSYFDARDAATAAAVILFNVDRENNYGFSLVAGVSAQGL